MATVEVIKVPVPNRTFTEECGSSTLALEGFQYELDQQKLTNVLKVDLKTDVMFYLYAKFAHTPFLALMKYTESVKRYFQIQSNFSCVKEKL